MSGKQNRSNRPTERSLFLGDPEEKDAFSLLVALKVGGVELALKKGLISKHTASILRLPKTQLELF